MRAVVLYGAGAAGVVLLGTALLWPLVDEPGRRGLLLAGGVAWPVQLAAFALLASRPPGRFLGAMAAGMGLRLVAIALVTIHAATNPGVDLVVALLALVGYLFVLLLLEPMLLGSGPRPEPRGPAEPEGKCALEHETTNETVK